MTSTLKTLALTLVIGFLGGLLGSVVYNATTGPQSLPSDQYFDDRPSASPGSTATPVSAEAADDFVQAADISSPSVVFIRTKSNYTSQRDNYWSFWDFFGQRRGPITSAGSGVIVTQDGYIVTNNHVIDKADEITVMLQNKHAYPAEVVGADPNTDLAVLKIKETKLPAIQMGNSDGVNIGEWVLAVGNPLNLKSTVTAGIVSAKGRNINIVNSTFPIESFIQTDAAINPGNSGGALVNLRGELVGINTAIKSETGAYSGYGFAIPVNLVRKVIRDLIDFGSVQQAFLGTEVVDINPKLGEQLPGSDYSGVFVQAVTEGGAADEAGIQAGDVILKINKVDIDSKAEYYERLAYKRPGDDIEIIVRRGEEPIRLTATLTNRDGGTGVLKETGRFMEKIGAKVTPLSKVERQRLNVDGGFRLTDIRRGLVAQMNLQEGFVILSINNTVPSDIDELADLLVNMRGNITIKGLNPNGSPVRYSFRRY